ncbi:hypothetical protein ACIOUE_25780 [Streptomyces xanthochromogenes]|uniref:hypothetical protein n=1 Tax=Streptomyces xanthochromogenes TaxID=67384 RepID=UPI0037FC1215
MPVVTSDLTTRHASVDSELPYTEAHFDLSESGRELEKAGRQTAPALAIDLSTAHGPNAALYDAQYRRPCGHAGGEGDSGEGSDGGGGNPPTGDSDDGRDYHHQ